MQADRFSLIAAGFRAAVSSGPTSQATLQGPLVISSAKMYGTGATTNSQGAAGYTQIASAIAAVGFTQPQVYFNGWTYTGNNPETDLNQPVTFQVAIKYNGTIYPVTFAGASQVQCAPGATVVSDAVPGLSVAAGDQFSVQAFMATTDANGQFAQDATLGGPGVDVSHDGFALGNVATSTQITRQQGAIGLWTCNAVTGTLSAALTPVIGAVGDSITDGVGDSPNTASFSWFTRGLNNAYPGMRLASPSDTLMAYVTGNREKSLQYIIGCTHTILALGTNDLYNHNPNQTVAQVKANYISLATRLRSLGTKVWGWTMLPRVFTSDQATTLSGQTQPSAETSRVQFNDWLRAGAPIDPSSRQPVAIGTAGALLAGVTGHPLQDYVDAADAVESSRNSGTWRVNGTAWYATSDGIHPSPVGSQLIGSAVFTAGRFTMANGGTGTVQVAAYKTTADQTALLAAQPHLAWSPYTGTAGTRPVTVDDSTQYQTMDGFGASMTDSAAYNIAQLPTSTRNSFMQEIFSPEQGMGMSVVRLPISASDFSLSNYTYDDSSTPDPSLAHFSIDHDRATIIPLLQQARALNPNLKIFASPWSAPAWMKTGGTGLVGGSLNPTYYAAYAQLFVQFVQAYAAVNLPIYALTVQNEPEYNTAGYPCMAMTAAQQADFIGNYLGPAFAAATITTKILAYDHNWDDTTYPQAVLADTTAGPYVAGTAWHGYAGHVSAQTVVHNAYPNKEIHLTEITGSTNGAFAADLAWHMRNIVLGGPLNWARSTMHWNLVLDQASGPSNGGASTVRPVVTIDSTSYAMTRNPEYYAIAHAAKFVRPGAQRIAATSYGAGYVVTTAYKNPDNSYVLVALCDAQSAQTFNVIMGSRYFSDTLQPGDVKTYVF